MRTLKSAVAAIIFAAVGAAAAEIVVPVRSVAGFPSDPGDRAWKKARAAIVPLVPQTYSTPHGGGTTQTVDVRSLVAGGTLFVRLQWADVTQNATLDYGGRFSDACAVQFPAQVGPLPSPMMGDKGRPVNLWHWRAANVTTERYEKAYSDFYRPGAIHEHVVFSTAAAQNLFAEGFGTLTPAQTQDVTAVARWENGTWSVVFQRRLSSPEGFAFRDKTLVPVAFAVWDGADKNRNGMKSLSQWHSLSLGGGVPDLKTPEERGARTFARFGCATCHGPEGKGGVININAQGGQVPPIQKVRDGFTQEEVAKVIREGRRSVPADLNDPEPPLRMTAWGRVMDDREIDDLVKYLWTLSAPSEEW